MRSTASDLRANGHRLNGEPKAEANATERLSPVDKAYLLNIARQSVGYFLERGQKLEIEPGEVPSQRLTENGASFVTLHELGHLRGCIGTLEAHRPLVFDVLENALCSAFEDPRFHPLRRDDLGAVRFSISVLTRPAPLMVKDADDLLERLTHKHGLIIRKGWNRATYLPAVWEQIPDKRHFLDSLCAKAGLRPDEWKDTAGMEFLTYEADEFSE
ncbi:MAG: AmmeMemoRadiSam system protein A [Candidatus Micrarchaeota archaeon]